MGDRSKYPQGYSEKQKADFDEIREIAKSVPETVGFGILEDNEYTAYIQVSTYKITDEMYRISRNFNAPSNGHSISLMFVTNDFNEGIPYCITA